MLAQVAAIGADEDREEVTHDRLGVLGIHTVRGIEGAGGDSDLAQGQPPRSGASLRRGAVRSDSRLVAIPSDKTFQCTCVDGESTWNTFSHMISRYR